MIVCPCIPIVFKIVFIFKSNLAWTRLKDLWLVCQSFQRKSVLLMRIIKQTIFCYMFMSVYILYGTVPSKEHVTLWFSGILYVGISLFRYCFLAYIMYIRPLILVFLHINLQFLSLL